MKYVEEVLLDSLPSEKLHATVLKAGHHGSETSSTLPFIRAVDPEIVVVLSGMRPFGNRFLPDTTVLRRFCFVNPEVRIFRTDRNDDAQGLDGTSDTDGDHILIRTNGDSLEVRGAGSTEPWWIRRLARETPQEATTANTGALPQCSAGLRDYTTTVVSPSP